MSRFREHGVGIQSQGNLTFSQKARLLEVAVFSSSESDSPTEMFPLVQNFKQMPIDS